MTRTEVLPVEVQVLPVEDTRECPECVFSHIFPCFIIHGSLLYFLHTSKSFQNHLGISFLFNSSFNFISSFKNPSWISSKTLLIWVITHTQTRHENLLGFILNPNSITLYQPWIHPQREDFMSFLSHMGFYPPYLLSFLG